MSTAAPDRHLIDDLVARALAEDLGVDAAALLGGSSEALLASDVTTHAVVGADERFAGRVVARAAGVACGIALAVRVWEMLARATGLADGLEVTARLAEGDAVEPGTVVAEVSGPAAVVLGGERTALNMLMVFSGIATAAHVWQEEAGPDLTVLDTRKTLPGLRALSKWAVAMGGATPHRAGLWDMVLVKDNHIRMAGGIAAAVAAACAGAPGLAIEVEADTVEQAEEAAHAGADIVLLDNMSPADLARAVTVVRAACERFGGRCHTEASGNVTLADLPAIVAAGVDRVSTSALTLAAPLDFGLDEAGEGS